MKQTIISITVIILFIAGLVFLTRYENSAIVPELGQSSASSSPLITRAPLEISIAQDSYLADVTGSYPRFTQASDRFNTVIKDEVELGIAEFLQMATMDFESRLAVGGDSFRSEFEQSGMYSYAVEYKIVQSNESYISVVVYTDGYAGGAHGYRTITTYNYDVTKDKILGVLDVYTAGGLQNISDIARAELEKKFKADGVYEESFISMMQEGTNPNIASNFSRFTFDENGLQLYFTEYQIAPYVYGTTKITLPLVQ